MVEYGLNAKDEDVIKMALDDARRDYFKEKRNIRDAESSTTG
jgi:hypothetical protein